MQPYNAESILVFDEETRHGYDYRVIRAPEGYATIYRNKKLLIRAEE